MNLDVNISELTVLKTNKQKNLKYQKENIIEDKYELGILFVTVMIYRNVELHPCGQSLIADRRRKRGARPPNSLGGGQHTLCPPPNNPPTFSFNFYVKEEKITNVPS